MKNLFNLDNVYFILNVFWMALIVLLSHHRYKYCNKVRLNMLFDDKLSDIIRTLESDGVLLHPTDTIWSLSCSLHSTQGINKINSMTKRDQNKPLTLLVDSLKMLKKHVPDIHPRIETLLHYHQKPLVVIYPNVKNIPATFKTEEKGRVPIRIIHDPYCNQIIKLLGNPLVSISANLMDQDLPTNFDDISDNIKIDADIISKHKRKELFSNKLSVTIDYDHDGEINFLKL